MSTPLTMTIELSEEDRDRFDRLIAALESAPAPAPAAKAEASTDDAPAEAETPAEEEAPASEYTREQVREALKAYAALESKEAAVQILKDHGAAALSELEESKFADVMKAVG